MPKRVVVLSKHSLLTDGIVSQLREYEHIFDVTVVDMQNAAAKLLKINPEILIVAALEEEGMENLLTASLLRLLPNTKIIQLDINNNNVQVFKSEQWRVQENCSLFSVLKKTIAL